MRRAVGLEAITGRSGQATAAPTATGSPCPIAPPVSVSQSCRGAPAVFGGEHRARGAALVGDDRALGQDRADGLGDLLGGRARPVGRGGAARRAPARGLGAARAERVRERLERADHVGRRWRQVVHLAAVGHEVARLARVGEERHGRLGVDQHEVLEPAQLDRRELGEVGEPLDGRQPGAALAGAWGTSRRAAWRRSRRRSVAAASRPRLAQRPAAEQDRGPAAVAQRPRDGLHEVAVEAGAAARVGPDGRPGSAPSHHDTSAGRISVATCPGGPVAAATASAASPARSAVLVRRSGPSPRRCARRSRCRTAAARRTACGRWRGRRRC